MPRFIVRDFVSCLSFDGSNDYAYVADHADFKITGDLTLGTWIKLTSYDNNAGLINKFTDDNNCEFHWRINQNTGFMYLQQGSGSGQLTYEDTKRVPIGQWCHIVVTKNSTNIKFYINGVLGVTGNTSATPVVATTAAVHIGRRTDGQLFLPGKLDDSFICNDDLTISQIQDIYYSGIYPSTNLKLRWKMDENAGTSLTDSSGLSHTGTLGATTAAPAWSTDVFMTSRTAV